MQRSQINAPPPSPFPARPPPASDTLCRRRDQSGSAPRLFLARDGHSVTLPGKKAASLARTIQPQRGWIRQQGRDPEEMPIMGEAADESGGDLAGQHERRIIRPTAGRLCLFGAETGAACPLRKTWLPNARANGAELAKMLTGCRGGRGSFPPSPHADRRVEMHARRTCARSLGSARAALPGMPPAEGSADHRKLRRTCNSTIAAGRVAGVITDRAVSNPSQVVLRRAWSALFPTQPRYFDAATLCARKMWASRRSRLAPKSMRVRIRRAGSHSVAARMALYALPTRCAPSCSSGAGCVPRVASLYDAICPCRILWPTLHPFATQGLPRAWGTKTALAAGAPIPFEAMRNPGSRPAIWPRSRRLLRDFFGDWFPEIWSR